MGFFVLYPQPTALGKSVYRLFVPPVAPEAIGELLDNLHLEEETKDIEKYVLTALPYSYDWQIYCLP